MSSSKRYTITAALPYTNGPIHIGHLAGVYVSADIYARYLRLTGNDVAYICGSDEHGVAIPMKAKKEGVKKFIYISVLNGKKLRHLKICEAKEKLGIYLKSLGMDYCIIRPNGFFSDMKDFLKMVLLLNITETMTVFLTHFYQI